MARTIDLSAFGLEQKESSAYLALLELGSGSALKVSQKTGLPKSTSHDILANLTARGFCSSYTRKNTKIFTASDPNVLAERVHRQEELLRTVLPELRAMNNVMGSKPKMRYYEDKHGIEAALKEMFKEAKELIFMGNGDAAFQAFPEYFPRATEERIAQKIITRGILTEGPLAEQFKKDDPAAHRRTKTFPSNTKVTPLAWIWNNKFVIFNTVGVPSVLILEDREIVNLLRVLFEIAWQ